MKKIAIVYSGVIGQIFETEENASDLLHPDIVWVDVTNSVPTPDVGWVGTESGAGWSFAPYTKPEPTDAEILASQSAKLQQATQLASGQKTALANRIGTLNDAVELGMATPEEVNEIPLRQAQLLEWKRYAVLLGRVTGQDGWPPEVEWPEQPAEGMDLTVSSVEPGSSQLQ